jgi:FkbM family methyltransferase
MRWASGILRRVGMPLLRASERLYQPEQARRVRAWERDAGDRTLRLDYDLGARSVVLDVGGYEGQWASDIYAAYRCRIHVLEPIEIQAAHIGRRFARNPDIQVHAVGMAGTTRTAAMAVLHSASSTFKTSAGRDVERVTLVDAAEFFAKHDLELVHLMKINIEGGEYELLERLIETGLVDRLRDIQIQFHDFVPNAEARCAAIQTALSATHEPTYQYPFVWENWRSKTLR